MLEVIPVAIGLLLGLATHSVASPLRRSVSVLGLSLAGAVLAALVSAEFLRSWTYVIFDFAQVALVAFATGSVWRLRNKVERKLV